MTTLAALALLIWTLLKAAESADSVAIALGAIAMSVLGVLMWGMANT